MGKRILVAGVALAAFTTNAAAKPRDLLAKPQVPPQERKVELSHDGKRLLLGVKLPDLLDAAQRARVRSGFRTQIEGRVELVRAAGKKVLSTRFERWAIHDRWDQKTHVFVREQRRRARLQFNRADFGEAVAALTTLKRVSIAPLAKVAKGKRYFVRVRVVLNPVSEWLRVKMKQWHKRGCRDRIPRRMGGGHSTFVEGVCDTAARGAEKVLEFRSQSFTLPDVKRRP